MRVRIRKDDVILWDVDPCHFVRLLMPALHTLAGHRNLVNQLDVRTLFPLSVEVEANGQIESVIVEADMNDDYPPLRALISRGDHFYWEGLFVPRLSQARRALPFAVSE
jgi:hypothetical protein